MSSAAVNPRRLPAEWQPQAAMLLVWPRSGADWGDGLEAARDTIAAMAAALAADQPVVLVVADREARDSAVRHPALADIQPPRLDLIEAANNDIWIRDSGPLTVFDPEMRVFLDFRFDGWGGQFAADDDDALTAELYALGVLGAGALEHQAWVLEGGSIESNGAGTLLTTERCLLAGRRNPGVGRGEIAARLAAACGAHTLHWLRSGELIGDDTDGHVDTLARFVDEYSIVYQGCRDRQDAHYPALAAMAEELAGLQASDGADYRLYELPLPAAIYDPEDGHRLPAGYANFVIGERCILLPVFDDPADAEAERVLAECFADRQIVAIDARALIRQHGSLHCAAMQIPARPYRV